MISIKNITLIFYFIVITIINTSAQFMDNFDGNKIVGWFFFTGDGGAKMDFIPMNGYGRMIVDGTKDKDNVYWTLIKRDVTQFLDLSKFKNPDFQLRVEAKVKVHNAPRRLNFMVNTNRTTNYHIDLMEYDIPDTTNWHVISMTTRKFDANPGDTVYVQLCATDYGLGKYYVDLDYYRADIVNVKIAGPDKGELVPYHPPVPLITVFNNHLPASQTCLINSDYPDVNLNKWGIKEKDDLVKTLTICANQWGILRWNFDNYKNTQVDQAGILELTTHSILKGGDYVKAFGKEFGEEFGKVRVIEILEGDPNWNQSTVTFNSLTQGKSYSEIFNTQMIYDLEVNEGPGEKNYVTISKPVLQRLLSGKTKGLLLRPLGAIVASFYADANQPERNVPIIHFNVVKK
jgi:hypothetical protein